MSHITLQGAPVETNGTLPLIGSNAPRFTLVRNDLSEVSLETYAGKTKILNIFPSIDTPVCAQSVRTFNQRASELDNVVVLNISPDLPFAQTRFCGAEGIENTETLSCYRGRFASDYGICMTNGAFAHLCARAIVVLNPDDTVKYTELVGEIADPVNFDAALAAAAE